MEKCSEEDRRLAAPKEARMIALTTISPIWWYFWCVSCWGTMSESVRVIPTPPNAPLSTASGPLISSNQHLPEIFLLPKKIGALRLENRVRVYEDHMTA